MAKHNIHCNLVWTEKRGHVASNHKLQVNSLHYIGCFCRETESLRCYLYTYTHNLTNQKMVESKQHHVRPFKYYLEHTPDTLLRFVTICLLYEKVIPV